MLADLTVLLQDIFSIPAQNLPATLSLMTVINGRTVCQSAESISFSK